MVGSSWEALAGGIEAGDQVGVKGVEDDKPPSINPYGLHGRATRGGLRLCCRVGRALFWPSRPIGYRLDVSENLLQDFLNPHLNTPSSGLGAARLRARRASREHTSSGLGLGAPAPYARRSVGSPRVTGNPLSRCER